MTSQRVKPPRDFQSGHAPGGFHFLVSKLGGFPVCPGPRLGAAMADGTLRLERLQRRLEAAGQAHVLRFWPELGEQERRRLLQELSLLQPEALREHCAAAAEAAASPAASLDGLIEPLPPQSIGSATRSGPERVREWEQLGECALDSIEAPRPG